jgi:hypothetical protein
VLDESEDLCFIITFDVSNLLFCELWDGPMEECTSGDVNECASMVGAPDTVVKGCVSGMNDCVLFVWGDHYEVDAL